MSHLEFFETQVRSITAESDTVMSIELRDPLKGKLPEWSAGAHLDVKLPNGMVRQFSLCSDPADRSAWRLAVLREPAGRGGSAYVHDQLRPGITLEVRGPKNNFALDEGEEFIFIAGGIGITPIMPMVRAAENAGANWRLIYLGRQRKSMAFLDELAVYGNKVQLHTTQNNQPRFDLEALLGDPSAKTHVFACGPSALLHNLEEIASTWDDPKRLHLERFEADHSSGVSVTAEQEGDHEFVVVLNDGAEVSVPSGTTILQALENQGIFPINSCREGICGTCETAVVSGEIDHRDSLLSEEEQAAQDTMMICVSRCSGKRLVLDLN